MKLIDLFEVTQFNRGELEYSRTQSRVKTGSSAQKEVAKHLKKHHNAKKVKTAKWSTPHTDVEAQIDKENINVEVKNRLRSWDGVALWDSYAERGVRHYELDHIASLFIGSRTTFTKLIDHLRKTDKTIGFPGDDGVTGTSSGNLKGLVMKPNNKNFDKLVDVIQDNFKERNDNYLAIKTPTAQHYFYTGVGKNKLKMPLWKDAIKSIRLTTFGGTKGKPMLRVALKVNIDTPE